MTPGTPALPAGSLPTRPPTQCALGATPFGHTCCTTGALLSQCRERLGPRAALGSECTATAAPKVFPLLGCLPSLGQHHVVLNQSGARHLCGEAFPVTPDGLPVPPAAASPLRPPGRTEGPIRDGPQGPPLYSQGLAHSGPLVEV